MAHHYFQLTDKIAFITGAGSGIGHSIAQVYSEAGAKVWVADINEKNSNETVEMILSKGKKAAYCYCDVTNPETINDAVKQVLSEDQHIDILVNNAGVGHVGNILNTSESDFDRLMNVNVKGIYNVTKIVLPTMLEQQQGTIINMASIASIIGVKDRFVYCASKGAVLMMTKSIALDFVDQGIRCNCICPTRIHTPFVDDYLSKNYPGQEAEMFQKLSEYQPIGRMGKPEEVAYLALYLASEEASFHTGDAFPIAGGKLMG